MNQPGITVFEERVLVLAPTPTDGNMTQTLLTEAGLGFQVCLDLATLCHEYERGAGVILLTEEALAFDASKCLVDQLRQQPPWSDLPILLLAGSGADSPVAQWALDLLGNVTVLERPVRVTTLVSSLRAALRARRRQYELRSRVDTLRRQDERLRLLWEAASILLSADNPDAMMRGLFAKLSPNLGLDAYFNYMVEESGATLRMESCVGIPDEEMRAITRLEFGTAVCGTVAQQCQPITATHIQQSDDPRVQLVKRFGLRVYACNPLMAGDRLLGTLSFASRSRDTFEPDELEFLQTVCHYVAYAYERLRLIRQLRQEDEKKDEFLATLAHELRNPLAPLRNGLQIMRLAGTDRAAIEQSRNMMERQLEQMVLLVNDLLDLSRVSRGKVELRKERVELARVVQQAVETSRPLIEEAHHDLSISSPAGPIFVEADPTRLVQVFANLLNNAAKYTDLGGRIHLSIERDGSEVVVRVTDTGVGIPAHMLAKVFDMFTQVDRSLEKTRGGLGIGLSLVKKLVEMHGGTVGARSNGHGTGSEFIVRLPVVLSLVDAQRAAGKGDEKKTASGRRRILVVDDNRDSANSLAMLLRVMGNDAQTAHDGLEALDVAPVFRPDVILLDIGMPRLDGYETARRIRSEPWGKGVVLVAQTGWGQEEDKRRSREAGFDSHLVKPIDPAGLEKLLASLHVGTA
ncbi:MAG: ATP-binding protein [Gemmataceae bacterium]